MTVPVNNISTASITNNRVILSNIFDNKIKNYSVDDQTWVIDRINELLTDNQIELIQNLKDAEIASLVRLFIAGLNVNQSNADDKDNFKKKALHWVNTLVLAQPIQNQPNNIYISQKSLTNELRINKAVSLTEWGADIDLKNYFGNEMLPNLESVNGPGFYILPPSALDSIVIDNNEIYNFKSVLQGSLENIKKKNITGDVSLRIPVNCNGNHWRLLKVEIKNEAITGVELWDPLGNDIKGKIAHLKSAVDEVTAPAKINISVMPSGNQTNSHSCMDYVVQEIYKNKNVVNDITNANSSNDLRLAITKQIAKSIPELDQNFTANLRIVNGFVQSQPLDNEEVIPLNEEIKLDKEQEAFLIALPTNKDQVAFDATFAVELQKIYYDNKFQMKSEDILLKNALVRAFGIFKKNKNKAAPAVDSSVVSSSLPRNP